MFPRTFLVLEGPPVCMYVCMYVCIYVCMYIYICDCIYVCMYVCMYVCIYVCMYVCIYIYMLVSMYVCTKICILCRWIHLVCMHACMYVCTYVCIHASTYPHRDRHRLTSAHTHKRPPDTYKYTHSHTLHTYLTAKLGASRPIVSSAYPPI